jgi:hypothetical protein
MGLLDAFFRKPRLTGAPELADFMDSRAAFMVQKCVYEYARARSGLLSSKLFKEAAFRTELEKARWGNYPLALRSVAVMVEHTLRPAAVGDAPAMREGLIAAVDEICRRYPLPEGFSADFWLSARDDIARRIRQAGLAAPHAIKDIPLETAREFFRRLPIHPDLRSHDFELVTNNLRVNLCRAYEDLLEVADCPALARSLAAAGEAGRKVDG